MAVDIASTPKSGTQNRDSGVLNPKFVNPERVIGD